MIRLVVVLILLWLIVPAIARDPTGIWSQYSPKQRQWLREQKSQSGKLCCNEADGVHAEEDIRDGRYWVRFVAWPGTMQSKTVDWISVPDEAIITRGNLIGSPIVWFYLEDGQFKVRCFAPGAKL